MRIQSQCRPLSPYRRPAAPPAEDYGYYKDSDFSASGWTALAGVSAVGAAAGYCAGHFGNPWLSAGLGSLAGASAGLTGAAFFKKKPFLTLGLVGATAGALVAVKVHHPVATGLLTLAGATLPVGLVLGLMDGFE